MGVSEAEEVYKAEYPADPRMVHEVRELVQRLIAGKTSSADELEEVKVAISEAFSNAVCHGSPKGNLNTVGVRCMLSPEEFVVEVTDQGGGFQPEEISLPRFEEWKPSGRGLFLISALMDDVQFEPTAEGTRVRMVKRLVPQPEEVETVTDGRPVHTSGMTHGLNPFSVAPALVQDLC